MHIVLFFISMCCIYNIYCSIRTFRMVECIYYVLFGMAFYYGIESNDFSKFQIVDVYNATSGIVARRAPCSDDRYLINLSLYAWKCMFMVYLA